jgi:hypothetical protein
MSADVVRTSATVRVYPTNEFLPSAPTVKKASVQTRLRPGGRGVDALMRPRRPVQTLEKNKFFFFSFFWVVVARWKREEKNILFGFRFSIPKIPKIPKIRELCGEATRRRRFFRPSSPSHLSKLYSSFGWLNSKVPKPFFPFTLWLIDVDGLLMLMAY